MRNLQAFGLIFVLVAGLFLGITEPWIDETDQGPEPTVETDAVEQDVHHEDDHDHDHDDHDHGNSTSDEPKPLAEQCLDSHESLAMHIHPRLEMVVNNQSVTVPGDLGIDTTVCVQAMHLLHTHDASGKLHIEGYESFTPTADLIFEVWNISYPDDESLQPLFDDATNVTVKVNGTATNAAWHEIELIDGETLRIEHVG